MMRVAFAGTPDFSVPCLEALLGSSSVELVAVLSQPDRPAGRGKKIQQSPVKTYALEHNLTVLQPQSLAGETIESQLHEMQLDLLVVTAYGLLLPQRILDIPEKGCINLHASLLPRWRGAAPIQRAIQAGDTKTGVTLMKMMKALDAGPMLAIRELVISNEETGGSLHDKLSAMAGELLFDKLPEIESGSLVAADQDDGLATYADKLSKAETRLDWRLSATELERQIRAFNPWPTATTTLETKTLRVHQASVVRRETVLNYAPGEVVRSDGKGILVATKDHFLNLQVIQKPGGKPLAVADFLNGMAVPTGSIFG